MGFFDVIRESFGQAKESFRDKRMDNLCADFQNLGIDAQITDRYLADKEIFGGRKEYWFEQLGRVSAGIIEIPEGPIRYVNLKEESQVAPGGRSSSYHLQYIAPNPKPPLSSLKIEIKSVRKKTFPLFGRVVDIHWKSDDLVPGITDRLKSDVSIKRTLMHTNDVLIHDLGRCFVITVMGKVKPPTEEEWNCYQAIAKHLLAERSQSK
jgi:hypothetical protein